MPQPLHDIDKNIYSALNNLNDPPSAKVWETLDRQLPKKEEDDYRKQYLMFRRIAIVLFLMLLSMAIYEAGIVRTYKGADSEQALNNQTMEKAGGNEFSGETTIQSKVRNQLTTAKSETNLATPFPESAKLKHSSDYLLASGEEAELSTATISLLTLSNDIRQTIAIERQHQFGNFYFQPLILAGTAHPNLMDEKHLIEFNKSFSNVKKSAWTITPWLAREWTNYHLEEDVPDGSSATAVAATSQVRLNEIREPSFAQGIKLERRLWKNFFLQTGISYSQTAVGINPQEVVAKKVPDGTVAYRYNTSSGYAYLKPSFASNPIAGDSLYAMEAQHNLNYLQVPLTVQWKKKVKKVSLSAGAGFGINYLTRAALQTEIKDGNNHEVENVEQLQGMKKIYIDVIVNAGADYQLSNRLGINISPYFRRAVSSINKNNVVKTYPYSFGIATGISIRL